MDNTEAKTKDLQKFLRKNGIAYRDIEVDRHRSILHINDDVYISTRSGYYNKYAELGLQPLVLEMIKKYLLELSCSEEFDRGALLIEKQKLNTLLIKDAHTIKNSKLRVDIKRSDTFGGYTASRKQICIFDPPDEPIDEYLNIVPGVCYHELGHVLYTCSWPRLAKDIETLYVKYDPDAVNFSKKELDNAVGSVLGTFNALEDPRMENLMGNRFGASIPYFKSMMYKFLIRSIQEKVDMGEPVSAFDCALIAGRKYIEFDHRRWVFDKYMESSEDNTEETAKRVNMYINKFITLSWRANRKEMLEVGMGFFFEFVKPDLDKRSKQPQKSDWGELMEEMLQGIGSAMNELNDEDIDESEAEMLKKVLKDVLGGNKGSVDTKPDNEVREGMKDAQNEAEEEIKNNSKDIKKKLKKTNLDNKVNLDYDDQPITMSMKKDELKLEKTFKEFMKKCRNGYETRRKKGGVDIGEARRQQFRGGTRIFRQYRRDVKKALDIDIAFCLDCSYSMSSGDVISNIDEASRQLWIASTACRSVGATVKIFTFTDYDLGTFEQPKSKSLYRRPKYVDGTVISETMYKAENYLNCSKANSKWFVALTDGDINDPDRQNQILVRMKRDGITCGKINLTDNSGWGGGSSSGDEEYDHILEMHHDGRGNHNTMASNNIVTFFKNIYEMSLQREGLI